MLLIKDTVRRSRLLRRLLPKLLRRLLRILLRRFLRRLQRRLLRRLQRRLQRRFLQRLLQRFLSSDLTRGSGTLSIVVWWSRQVQDLMLILALLRVQQLLKGDRCLRELLRRSLRKLLRRLLVGRSLILVVVAAIRKEGSIHSLTGVFLLPYSN